MIRTRNIKRYMRGDDVWAVKLRLVQLGYLERATHDRFGNDSYQAVRAFQSANNLEVDGIVGEYTWAALFSEQPQPSVEIPEHIGKAARKLIAADLAGVSEIRQRICIEALRWAVDPDAWRDLFCFYIRGGNLYDDAKSVHYMTSARLESYFHRSAYEPYYKGYEDDMRAMAARSGYKIAGCDCSGLIVGLWRHAGVAGEGFDATADRLYGSYCTPVSDPSPGDLVHKSGHIGIYVGGGYTVESAGGRYGCQLTKLKKRRLYNIHTGKYETQKAWDHIGDPKSY